MRGPKPSYPIQLLDNQIIVLRQLVNSRKASQGKVMRAWGILAAHNTSGVEQPANRADGML